MRCTKAIFSKWLRRATAAALLTSSALAIITVTATYLDDSALFELDGNAVKNGVGDDWAQAKDPGPGYEPALLKAVATSAPEAGMCTVPGFSFVVCDPTGASDVSEFVGGGSKDTNDVSQWKNTSMSVPDKDDITNAYAAAYSVNTGDTQPHTWIYFGADRFANNGDSNIGFWFFQNSIAPGSGQGGSGTPFQGTPCPANATNCSSGDLHRDGDILIVSAFTQGGAIGTIQLYHWDHTKGGLVLDDDVNGAACTPANPGHQEVCAIINQSPAVAPWSYTPKFGTAGSFPPGSFFEGGFDLTALARKAGIPVPCFSTFLAETRTSQTETSQLKDFVLGNFNLCGLTINGSCPAIPTYDVSPPLIHYTFNGKVAGIGGSPLYDLKVSSTGVVPSGVTNLKINQPDANGNYSGTFDFPLLGSVSLSFAACGSTSPGGPCNVTTDNSDPANPKPAVAAIEFGNNLCRIEPIASMSLAKSCEVNLVPGPGGVTLQLADTITVCNTSLKDSISNISISNTVANLNTVTPAVIIDLTLVAGECRTFKPAYTPNNCVNSVLNGANADPGRCVFSDVARLSSIPVNEFGSPVGLLPAPVFASCTVCPNGVCAAAAAH